MESCIIAENYVPRKELTKVIKAFYFAQELKEYSWDGQKYQVKYHKASVEAIKKFGCKELWVDVIETWLSSLSVEVEEWADNYLKEEDYDD